MGAGEVLKITESVIEVRKNNYQGVFRRTVESFSDRICERKC